MRKFNLEGFKKFTSSAIENTTQFAQTSTTKIKTGTAKLNEKRKEYEENRKEKQKEKEEEALKAAIEESKELKAQLNALTIQIEQNSSQFYALKDRLENFSYHAKIAIAKAEDNHKTEDLVFESLDEDEIDKRFGCYLEANPSYKEEYNKTATIHLKLEKKLLAVKLKVIATQTFQNSHNALTANIQKYENEGEEFPSSKDVIRINQQASVEISAITEKFQHIKQSILDVDLQCFRWYALETMISTRNAIQQFFIAQSTLNKDVVKKILELPVCDRLDEFIENSIIKNANIDIDDKTIEHYRNLLTYYFYYRKIIDYVRSISIHSFNSFAINLKAFYDNLKAMNNCKVKIEKYATTNSEGRKTTLPGAEVLHDMFTKNHVLIVPDIKDDNTDSATQIAISLSPTIDVLKDNLYLSIDIDQEKQILKEEISKGLKELEEFEKKIQARQNQLTELQKEIDLLKNQIKNPIEPPKYQTNPNHNRLEKIENEVQQQEKYKGLLEEAIKKAELESLKKEIDTLENEISRIKQQLPEEDIPQSPEIKTNTLSKATSIQEEIEQNQKREQSLDGQIDLVKSRIGQHKSYLALLKEKEKRKQNQKQNKPMANNTKNSGFNSTSQRSSGNGSVSQLAPGYRGIIMRAFKGDYNKAENRKQYKGDQSFPCLKRLARRRKSRNDMVNFIRYITITNNALKDIDNEEQKAMLSYAALLVVKHAIENEQPRNHWPSVMLCICNALTENNFYSLKEDKRENALSQLQNFWSSNHKDKPEMKNWDVDQAIKNVNSYS